MLSTVSETEALVGRNMGDLLGKRVQEMARVAIRDIMSRERSGGLRALRLSPYCSRVTDAPLPSYLSRARYSQLYGHPNKELSCLRTRDINKTYRISE